MAVAGAEVIEQFGVVASRRFAGKVLPVAHFDRRRGVVVGHAAVFDEYARYAVRRSGHDVVVVEAQVGRRGAKGGVPILRAALFAQTKMPFAESGGGIACMLEDVGQGILVGSDNHARVAGRHVGAGTPPSIFARQQGVARRSAGGGHGMGVGEADAFGCQAIYVGGTDTLCAVAGQIAVSQVVGIDEDDVGAFVVCCRLVFVGRFCSCGRGGKQG